MKEEVQCACDFLSRILVAKNVPQQFVRPFRRRLEELLLERYKDHWHPEHPHKGSAYRCIRINGKMDPVVREAAKVTGLDFSRYLPMELTMWIDPKEVAYRFGEDGSICACSMSVNESYHNSSENSNSTWNQPPSGCYDVFSNAQSNLESYAITRAIYTCKVHAPNTMKQYPNDVRQHQEAFQ
ncbi:hypothetical protein EMCRGX_G026965 [Ephydatia muelleri]